MYLNLSMKSFMSNNITRMFIKLWPVQFFVVIASSLSGIINGLVIGNYLSFEAMSALGLVTPVIGFLSALASIVSGGAGILCGKFMGKGDSDKVDQVFSISMIISFVCGLVLTFLIIIFAQPIALYLKADANTLQATVQYIRGMAIGIVPMLMMPSMMIFLQMSDQSYFSLATIIIMSVINAILNTFNIHLLKWGIFGIGLATSLSRYFAIAIIIGFLLVKRNLVKFNIKYFDLNIVKDILIMGSPASLAGILYSMRNVFINSYAFDLQGDVALNALAIMTSFGGFFDGFNIALGSTLTMLASVFVGERDGKSIKELTIISCVIGEFFAVLKVISMYLFGDDISILYGASNNLIDVSYELLRYYSWSSVPNMITVTIIGIYQSLGRISLCNIMYLFNCILTPLFCCTVLADIFNIQAIWSLYYLAEIVTLTIVFINSCIKKKALSKNLDDILYLDSIYSTENKYLKTINDISEVINVSKEVEDFCLKNNIDSRRAMFTGLCLEEMAGNIVEHGFIKDNKKHSIDLFTCVENDEVLMRLRDNCVPFDPNSRKQIVNPEDPAKNIGIRMVSKIAKEMNYHSNFGFNVLAIRL